MDITTQQPSQKGHANWHSRQKHLKTNKQETHLSENSDWHWELRSDDETALDLVARQGFSDKVKFSLRRKWQKVCRSYVRGRAVQVEREQQLQRLLGRKRSRKEASGLGVSREVRQGREGKATDEGYVVKPAATMGD